MDWNNKSTYQSNNEPYYKQHNNGQDDSLFTRCIISELNLITSNFYIVGLIVAKEDIRSFISRTSNSQKYLLNFTLRDSSIDIINATCWGSEQNISNIDKSFNIGDIVKISTPLIKEKATDGSEEKYRPSTPGKYHLNISEDKSKVELYIGSDLNLYAELSHTQNKPGNDFFSIQDIINGGHKIGKESINILGAIKQVLPTQKLVGKNGTDLMKSTVILLDKTANDFQLTLWGNELAKLSSIWKAKEHVIFASDVNVKYDNYRKSMVASNSSRTIITINPDTNEARDIYEYIQNIEIKQDVPKNKSQIVNENNINFSKITKCCNISEMQELASDDDIFVYIYSFLAHFDLDSSPEHVTPSVCEKCFKRCTKDICCNNSCTDKGSIGKRKYNIRLSFADHTGHIGNCFVKTEVIESMLSIPPEQFYEYDEQMKTEVKWKYLLERCKVYIKCSSNTTTTGEYRQFYQILKCNRVEASEMANSVFR